MLYISRSLESFTEGRGLVVQSTHWKSESTFLLQSQKRSKFQVMMGADLQTRAGDAQSALTAPCNSSEEVQLSLSVQPGSGWEPPAFPGSFQGLEFVPFNGPKKEQLLAKKDWLFHARVPGWTCSARAVPVFQTKDMIVPTRTRIILWPGKTTGDPLPF